MAVYTVAVPAVVEAEDLPILGVRMAAGTGAAIVVTVRRFSLVAGKALIDLTMGIADLIPILGIFMALDALLRVDMVQIAHADDNRLSVVANPLLESGYLAGVVLAIGVKRDDMREAVVLGPPSRLDDRRALASVHRETDPLDREPLERLGAAVGATVIDHQHTQPRAQRAFDHSAQRITVVVGRDRDQDANVFRV